MPLEIKKRENEATGAFIYRFNKRVKQSGILKEVRKRRFTNRAKNKRKVRLSALYKNRKAGEVALMRKYGLGPQGKYK